MPLVWEKSTSDLQKRLATLLDWLGEGITPTPVESETSAVCCDEELSPSWTFGNLVRKKKHVPYRAMMMQTVKESLLPPFTYGMDRLSSKNSGQLLKRECLWRDILSVRIVIFRKKRHLDWTFWKKTVPYNPGFIQVNSASEDQ
ncbi:hypothetical protein CEXT_815551 [Caerostris extrusa]|uniref:Uncharacterized protein n=1 Tax=Caerostris extrusa TaxID=172846 RepID=A0AAV4N461_CAEEX|nr:hypothetical protein CEXT_815551 [Caerostris extrusa]